MSWQHTGCGAATPGAWLNQLSSKPPSNKKLVRPCGLIERACGTDWNPFRWDDLLDRWGFPSEAVTTYCTGRNTTNGWLRRTAALGYPKRV